MADFSHTLPQTLKERCDDDSKLSSCVLETKNKKTVYVSVTDLFLLFNVCVILMKREGINRERRGLLRVEGCPSPCPMLPHESTYFLFAIDLFFQRGITSHKRERALDVLPKVCATVYEKYNFLFIYNEL